MKTLLVDNHDSYTYNVFHLLAAASGEEPMVVNNDAVSWRVLTRMDFDAIVLSPGPGHPSRWHDFGVCSDILRHSAPRDRLLVRLDGAVAEQPAERREAEARADVDEPEPPDPDVSAGGCNRGREAAIPDQHCAWPHESCR